MEISQVNLVDTKLKKNFIERNLVLPKLLYFSLNMAVYSTYFVLSNYFKEVWDVPIHHFGYISGLTSFGVFGSIFWTNLANKTGAHRNILLLTAVLFCLSFCLLRLEFMASASVWIKFPYVCFVLACSNFFVSALYPILDSCVFTILMKDPDFNTKLYGTQRLWGTIGQALISQLNAVMISKTPLKYHSIYINVVWSSLFFIVCIIFGIPKDLTLDDRRTVKKDSSAVPLDMPIKNDDPQSPDSMIPLSPIMRLLRSGQFLAFIFTVFSAGYVRSILGNFLAYYLEFDVHQSRIYYILAMQTKTISEVAFYFMGKHLLDYFGSFWMMLLGLVTGTIRVIGYTLISPKILSEYHLTFFLEFLKGVNNACVISAGVRIAHTVAPEGCETVAQGFFSGIQANLSNATGWIVGGLILDLYQSDPNSRQKLFMHTSIFATLSCLLYCIVFRLRPLNDHRRNQ